MNHYMNILQTAQLPHHVDYSTTALRELGIKEDTTGLVRCTPAVSPSLTNWTILTRRPRSAQHKTSPASSANCKNSGYSAASIRSPTLPTTRRIRRGRWRLRPWSRRLRRPSMSRRKLRKKRGRSERVSYEDIRWKIISREPSTCYQRAIWIRPIPPYVQKSRSRFSAKLGLDL